MSYTPFQWLVFFYIYSFLGWVFESSYVSLRKRKFVNRGFMKGPFLPIYGSGAVMMLFVSEPFQDNLVLTYFAGVVGATLLELVTGMALEAIFKVRYWDYSNQKFNYKGYICLSSSVAWGFFTIGMNQWLHPLVMGVLSGIPMLPLVIVTAIVTVGVCADVTVSVKEALDLRDILIRAEEMRREMVLLRRRADVIIACLDDRWKEFVEEHPGLERIEEIHNELEERLNKMKELRKTLPSMDDILTESQKKDIEAFKDMLGKVREKHTKYEKRNVRTFRQRIAGNPSMTSPKYPHSLENLKKRLQAEKNHREEENI